MTAKEFLDSLKFDTGNERLYLIALIAMKRYAQEKCKEQRALCYESSRCDRERCEENENARGCGAIVDQHSIQDATEPDFD